MQALPGHAFEQRHGGIRRCGPVQQGDTGQALAPAQIGKLGDKTSAKLLLQQVIKNYPNTSQARIARSSLQEMK